jgi:hypothetical protein
LHLKLKSALKTFLMKYLSILLAITALTVIPQVNAQTYVGGYQRSDGGYVNGHYRSTADGNFNNNWSTKGNYNPYTGAAGTRTPQYGTGSGYGSGSSSSSSGYRSGYNGIYGR